LMPGSGSGGDLVAVRGRPHEVDPDWQLRKVSLRSES
jgi:hypothetical protein